jgi:hypothetical protein
LQIFIELSDQSLAIAGALCAARGLQPQAIFTAPTEQFEKLLISLQRNAPATSERDRWLEEDG